MTSFTSVKLQAQVKNHPKSNPADIGYATSGLRDKAAILDSVVFRVGIVAALRSKVTGQGIGLMITASHNPAEDNGVKLIDFTGSMWDETWEPLCTRLVNEPDERLEETIKDMIKGMTFKSDGLVLIGMDTRESSPDLAKAAVDGVNAMDSLVKNFGYVTTPQLHYIVYAHNKGLDSATENGYYGKFSSAFQTLCSSLKVKQVSRYTTRLSLDCANGVGGHAMGKMCSMLLPDLELSLHNTGAGIVNCECGSFYVQSTCKEPVDCTCEPGERWASLDGDADRIIYFYRKDIDGPLRVLDGDKMAALFCLFLKDLLANCGLADKLSIQVIQTAYSNGAGTNFMKKILGVHVEWTATGVKHLLKKTPDRDISIWFEANGHGSIVYNENALSVIKETVGSDTTGSAALLLQIYDLLNQCTGDAISDLLLTEVILRSKDWTIEDWDGLYQPVPSRLLKTVVPDRRFIKTNEIATVVTEPSELQAEIDELLPQFGETSRVTVRASNTEDIVRVYVEAETPEKADQLGQSVITLVEKFARK